MTTGLGKVALILCASVVVAVAAFAVGSVVGGSGDDDGSTATQPSISASDDSTSHRSSPKATAGNTSTPQKPITIGFNGTASSPPFKLRGGDYRIDWTTRDECSYSVEMVPTIGSYGAQDLITTDKATSGGEVLRDVRARPYFAESVTNPPHGCTWEVTVTQVKPM